MHSALHCRSQLWVCEDCWNLARAIWSCGLIFLSLSPQRQWSSQTCPPGTSRWSLQNLREWQEQVATLPRCGSICHPCNYLKDDWVFTLLNIQYTSSLFFWSWQHYLADTRLGQGPGYTNANRLTSPTNRQMWQSSCWSSLTSPPHMFLHHRGLQL